VFADKRVLQGTCLVLNNDVNTSIKGGGKAIPNRLLGIQEVEAPRISRQSACQPYAPAAFIPQEIFLVLISVRH
jgi:hypothetical protein